jgi:integrase
MLTAQRRTSCDHRMVGDRQAAKLWTVPEVTTRSGRIWSARRPVLDLLDDLPGVWDGDKIAVRAVLRQRRRPLNFAAEGRHRPVSGVTEWTFHDIRRTARTRLSQIGVNADVAERVLGHLPGGIRGVYDRHDFLDEKRNALDLWARTLRAIVDNKSGQNVTPIRARA